MQPPSQNDPAPSDQEVELWWGGYAARTMLPSFGLCGLATGLLIGAAAYFSGEADPRGPVARWWAFWLIVGIWLFQSCRSAYRVAGYEYRLTSRRIYCIWGPRVAAPPPVELADLKTVRVEQTALDHTLGIGRIVLEAQVRLIPLTLTGVDNPEHIAGLIRRAAEQCRTNAAALPVQS